MIFTYCLHGSSLLSQHPSWKWTLWNDLLLKKSIINQPKLVCWYPSLVKLVWCMFRGVLRYFTAILDQVYNQSLNWFKNFSPPSRICLRIWLKRCMFAVYFLKQPSMMLSSLSNTLSLEAELVSNMSVWLCECSLYLYVLVWRRWEHALVVLEVKAWNESRCRHHGNAVSPLAFFFSALCCALSGVSFDETLAQNGSPASALALSRLFPFFLQLISSVSQSIFGRADASVTISITTCHN